MLAFSDENSYYLHQSKLFIYKRPQQFGFFKKRKKFIYTETATIINAFTLDKTIFKYVYAYEDICIYDKHFMSVSTYYLNRVCLFEAIVLKIYYQRVA